MRKLSYNRILLKLSGEVFGKARQGIDSVKIKQVVVELKAAKKLGVEIAIVVGGGNWWRKRDGDKQISDLFSDYMGMLGTVLNGLALADYLNKVGVKTELQSYLVSVPGIAKTSAKQACLSLQRGKVVIFAGGTGKPFVTTDTAAALRARDIKAHAIFKVGLTDAVYSADPDKNKSVNRFKILSFKQAIKKHLGIMDLGAYKICQQAKIPVLVFKWGKGSLLKVLAGKFNGTVINS
ncbi:MAG: UMP kinase [Patescibacteria group bacterium]